MQTGSYKLKAFFLQRNPIHFTYYQNFITILLSKQDSALKKYLLVFKSMDIFFSLLWIEIAHETRSWYSVGKPLPPVHQLFVSSLNQSLELPKAFFMASTYHQNYCRKVIVVDIEIIAKKCVCGSTNFINRKKNNIHKSRTLFQAT